MVHYLILAKIKDADLFAEYVRGHLPTIKQYGGKIVFRSTINTPITGSGNWDAIVIQEWPDSSDFDLWWESDEYKSWAQIRDKAATLIITKCENGLMI